MSFQPLLPPLLILTGLGGLLASYYWQYGPRHPVGCLRLVAIVILGVLLANPVRHRSIGETTREVLAIVVDSSGSMNESDSPGGTRYEDALAAAQRLSDSLRDGYDVEVYGLSEGLTSGVGDVPEGDTDFDRLTELAQSEPLPSALLLLSDGADWMVGTPEAELSAVGIPVHAVGVGTTTDVSNVALGLSTPSPSVDPGQELPLTCTVTASRDLVGETTELVLEEIASTGEPVELHRQNVRLGGLDRITVAVNVGDAIGARLWRARVGSFPDEVTPLDNVSHRSVQVLDREIRILVLEGSPYWDTTMAVRSWRRDRQLSVTTWYALGSRSYRAGRHLGRTIDGQLLAGLDVVVLGRNLEHWLDERSVADLEAYVTSGGSALVLGPGERLGGALAGLNPIRWSHQDAQEVTLPGSSILVPQPGPSVWAVPVAELAPHSRVMVGDREMPLAVYRRVGQGRVLSVNMEGIWRWRMGVVDQDDAASRFWREALRQLTRSVSGKLRSDRSRYMLGDEAVIWIAAEVQTGTIDYTYPDGTTTQLSFDEGRLRLPLVLAGLHRLQFGGEEMVLVVEEGSLESIQLGRDNARLRRMASATGGTMSDISEVEDLSQRLIRQRLLQTARQESVPRITERGWFLTLLVILGVEWFVRRRGFGLL